MKNVFFSLRTVIIIPLLLGFILISGLLATQQPPLLILSVYIITSLLLFYILYRITARIQILEKTAKDLAINEEDTENPASISKIIEFKTLNNSFHDLASQLQSAIDNLKKQVTYDHLTGLYTRQGLVDKFYNQSDFTNSAVLICTIERFRNINDSLGYEKANAVLIEVTQRMKSVLPKSHILARMSGTDFTIYAPNINDEAELKNTVRQLKETFESEIVLSGDAIFITLVIGATLLPSKHTIELGLRSANIALTYAKKEPSRYALYHPEMTDASVKRSQFVVKMKQGIENKEFIPYYQPLIDLKTNTIIGAEALARWKTPEGGIISPDEFIPLSEEYGLINDFGYQILLQACSDTKQAMDDGRWEKNFHLHVNVSVKQLLFAHFSTDLKNILEKTQLPTENLTLEITESNILNKSPVMEANLATIAELGISLAIDDFGTGYSSLSYLQNMNFDSLKIDRSFVKHLEEDTADKSIVSSILTMTRNFDVPVVSEGIETKEQAQILNRLGCQVAQGYLYSRPVPLEEWPDELNDK